MGAAGSTPIHKAAKEGNLSELYVAVQKYAALINEQEKELGYSALHVAAWEGFDAIVRELLKRGANPNLQDKEGRTPLHLAALRSHMQVVMALLRANARRDIRDNINHTAYDIAASRNPSIAAMIGPPALAPAPAPSTPTQQDTATTQAHQDTGARVSGTGGGASASTTPSIYPSLPGAEPAGTSTTPTGKDGQDEYGLYGPNRHALFPPSYHPQTTTAAQSAYPSMPHKGRYPSQAGAQEPEVPSAPAYPPPQPPVPAYASPYQAIPSVPSPAVQAAAVVPLPPGGMSATHDDGAQDWVLTGDAGWGGDQAAPVPTQPTTNVPAAAAAAGAPPARNPATLPSPPLAGPAAIPQKHGNPLRGLFTAADLALQQLAKLGLNAIQQGNNSPANQQLQQQLQQTEGVGAKAAAEAAGASSASSAGAAYAGPPGRVYHYANIAGATEYFAADNLIGQGGFGAVYRGVLDGIPVAVKKMDDGPQAMQGQKEFAAEVNILTRLHHPHVVLLVGSCPDKGLLVYELMEGGSLEERLFRPTPERPALAWQDRVRIAAEVASALLYLHSAPEPIVHMDLKPANILLDRTLRAKLGDVGLARLMGKPPGLPDAQDPSTIQDSQLVGTLAYVDPEYLRTGHFSTKSDLYALGMVMLQMLTGKEQSSVVSTVEEARQEVLNFTRVLDPQAGPWPAAEAVAFADIALKCTEFRRTKRPDLRTEVLPALLQLKQRTSLYADSAAGNTTSSGPSRTSASAPASAVQAPHSQGVYQSSGGGSTASAGMTTGPMDATSGVPAMFMCPITQDVMRDPVVAADGYTYEREAIAAWLSRSKTSPLTNLPLETDALVPNMLLRSNIREWQQQQLQQQQQPQQRAMAYA